MWYLSTPYAHESEKVVEYRFIVAQVVTAALIREGLPVFSPIAHCHPLRRVSILPTDWNFWKPWCEASLAMCGSLFLLRVEGWHCSVGMEAEWKWYKERNRPWEFIYIDGRFVCNELDERIAYFSVREYQVLTDEYIKTFGACYQSSKCMEKPKWMVEANI